MTSTSRFLRLGCACATLALTQYTVFAAALPPRTWSDEAFSPVTAARIAALPEADREAWASYLERSSAESAKLPKREKPEFSPLKPLNTPPAGGAHSRGLNLNAHKTWFASAEAQTIADRIVAAQSVTGGWRKGVDYTKPAAGSKAGESKDVWMGGTLDNDATTWELRELALTVTAANESSKTETWRQSFLRGIDYILNAQYPNGGFPQVYPLVGGYHDGITYNDDAMTQALELLRDIAVGRPEFAFASTELRQRCATAVSLGVSCILKTQLKTADGKLAVWCQQYDAITLAPAAARNFEPIANCTNESASVVRFLMTLPSPSPEIVQSVSSAVAWFERTAIAGEAWEHKNGTRRLVERRGGQLLWARLYELNTDKPVFGDRDRTIHYSVEEISSERRDGYAWYGTWPAAAIEAYQKWPARPR